MAQTLTIADLAHFTGSDTLYTNHLYNAVRYTEGARHIAIAGEAWWLLDAICISATRVERLRREAFQVWTFTVKDGRGRLVCTDGDDDTPLYTQRFAYTDFPLPTITLWVSGNVAMLPSEY